MNTDDAFEALADDPLHSPGSIGEWDIQSGIVANGSLRSPDRHGDLVCIRGYNEEKEELHLDGNSNDGWTVTYLVYDVPGESNEVSGTDLEPYEQSHELSQHDDLNDAAAALVEELASQT